MAPATSVPPDPGTGSGQRCRRRPAGDLIARLTVGSDSGTPRPAPVWFLRDEARGEARGR